MKNKILPLLIFIFLGGLAMTTKANECPALLNHNFKTLDGKDKSLCDFKGKVVLVVNTASECGFTGQYKGLEALYKKYKDQGLVILGFPANDFGKQEPGSDAEIKTFCERNYGVTFPMFAKTSVKNGENPFFKALIEASKDKPGWNFHKYLIARDGSFFKSYGSTTKPEGSKLEDDIIELLK